MEKKCTKSTRKVEDEEVLVIESVKWEGRAGVLAHEDLKHNS